MNQQRAISIIGDSLRLDPTALKTKPNKGQIAALDILADKTYLPASVASVGEAQLDALGLGSNASFADVVAAIRA